MTEVTVPADPRPRADSHRADHGAPTSPPDGPAPTVVATGPPPHAERDGAGVRLRVSAWVLLLMAVTSAAIVLTTYSLLDRQAENRGEAALAREAEEFAAHARGGVDRATGRPFTDTRDLLASHLRRQVADPGTVVAGMVHGAGRPVLRAPRSESFPLAERRDLLDRIAVSPSGTGSLATEDGELRWAKVDVTARPGAVPDPGVYVVGRLTAGDHARTMEIVRTLAWVSLAGVALSGFAAWLVAGRMLASMRRAHRTTALTAEPALGRRVALSAHDDGATPADRSDATLDRLDATSRRHLEDLLLLAEAEHPDFLQAEPTSVAELTREVDVTVREWSDRRWVLETVGEGSAVVDRRRVTQAMLQLARNAVAHTGPGDEIRLGSTLHVGEDGHRHASFWVTDTGLGVDPALAPTIFDRYTRGRSTSHRPGAGLGLAVVKAVADAHGGVVRLCSQPAQGTTFGFELPAPGPGA